MLAIPFIAASQTEKEASLFTTFREPATEGLYLASFKSRWL